MGGLPFEFQPKNNLAQFIYAMEAVDLGYIGIKFTCFNNREDEDQIRKSLDIVITSTN